MLGRTGQAPQAGINSAGRCQHAVGRSFTEHKTEHHEQDRIIAIGPNGQELLLPLLEGLSPGDFVFSPRRAREDRYRLLRQGRKSKVQPSQASRKKAKPKKLPKERYSTESYAHSIEWACAKHGLEHWHPNQLRHLHGTEVRKKYGLEAAQVTLGHAKADVTQIYAERDLALAVKVAKEMG